MGGDGGAAAAAVLCAMVTERGVRTQPIECKVSRQGRVRTRIAFGTGGGEVSGGRHCVGGIHSEVRVSAVDRHGESGKDGRSLARIEEQRRVITGRNVPVSSAGDRNPDCAT